MTLLHVLLLFASSKTTLSVVVVVVLIALTVANVLEFSESAQKSVHSFYGAIRLQKAKLINSKLPLELQGWEIMGGDTLLLMSKSIPQQEKGKAYTECEKYHGINIDNFSRVHCRINRFGFKVYKSADEAVTNVEIIMLLRHPDKPNGILLDVPMFRIPTFGRKLITKVDELETWANKEQVGVIPPITVEQLDDIVNGRPITIEFKWLNHRSGVLYHEVMEAAPADPLTEVFIARPIVLSGKILEKIIRVTEYFVYLAANNTVIRQATGADEQSH